MEERSQPHAQIALPSPGLSLSTGILSLSVYHFTGTLQSCRHDLADGQWGSQGPHFNGEVISSLRIPRNRRLRKMRKAAISFVMSVRPPTWNNSAPTGRIFMKFDI